MLVLPVIFILRFSYNFNGQCCSNGDQNHSAIVELLKMMFYLVFETVFVV